MASLFTRSDCPRKYVVGCEENCERDDNTMPRRPSTKDALWNIIEDAWDRVSSRRQYLRRLIASIPLDIVLPFCAQDCGVDPGLDRGLKYQMLMLVDVLVLVVVNTEDVQNVHLLLEYRPHIDVSLTCEHDPKLQEYCVCPQNIPQFDSEGIPNQAPETNKPMILNDPTSRNREGSDQVSVEAKKLGHLYLSIDQETFDPSTGEPYD
ncbi:hypothetical protein ANN_03299 [Periplaneta americana]|uniref:Uncharacterized protein n=1 Tax=Periplaneta americana TaxID=6978 RepID=A0ABQ8TYR4_PERAM|nr:hypothetical protein ANN_03299 [Periplaneta americana]